MGGGGGGEGSSNQGELDFVNRRCVGILTSTTIPGMGNLTRRAVARKKLMTEAMSMEDMTEAICPWLSSLPRY